MSIFCIGDRGGGGLIPEWGALAGALPLACFTAWLIAFPMGGFLLPGPNDQSSMLFFLIPHAITLMAIAALAEGRLFDRLSKAGSAVAVLLTISFPLLEPQTPAALVVLGIGGAFVSLRACALLSQSTAPVLCAGMGIGLGNGLALLLSMLPLPRFSLFALAGLLLVLVPACRLDASSSEEPPARDIRDLRRYFPFIYVFYLTGGLMFCYLAPRYAEKAFAGDISLFFYIFSAAAGVACIRKSLDMTLLGGIVLGNLAFLLLWSEKSLSLNLGMILMQCSFGLIDLVCIALFLSYRQPIKAFGYGLGVTSLGIASGGIVSVHLTDWVASMIVVGDFATSLSLVMIYLNVRRTQPGHFLDQVGSSPAEAAPEPKGDVERAKGWSDRDIEALLAKESADPLEKGFSQREKLVVELVLRGKTYRETAKDLGISESTVKTYMRRIYEKRGVCSKEGLLVLLKDRTPDGRGIKK